jgi:hypothetical protein
MKSRRCMSCPKLRRPDPNASIEYFDRAQIGHQNHCRSAQPISLTVIPPDDCSHTILGSCWLLSCSTTLISLSNSSLVSTVLSVVGLLRPEQSGVLLLTYGAPPMFELAPILIVLLRHFDARTVVVLGFSAFVCRHRICIRRADVSGSVQAEKGFRFKKRLHPELAVFAADA